MDDKDYNPVFNDGELDRAEARLVRALGDKKDKFHQLALLVQFASQADAAKTIALIGFYETKNIVPPPWLYEFYSQRQPALFDYPREICTFLNHQRGNGCSRHPCRLHSCIICGVEGHGAFEWTSGGTRKCEKMRYLEQIVVEFGTEVGVDEGLVAFGVAKRCSRARRELGAPVSTSASTAPSLSSLTTSSVATTGSTTAATNSTTFASGVAAAAATNGASSAATTVEAAAPAVGGSRIDLRQIMSAFSDDVPNPIPLGNASDVLTTSLSPTLQLPRQSAIVCENERTKLYFATLTVGGYVTDVAVKLFKLRSSTNERAEDAANAVKEIELMLSMCSVFDGMVSLKNSPQYQIKLWGVDYVFFMMEKMTGDLAQMINNEPQLVATRESISDVVQQLLNAYAKLHELGYWHRDVKPHNVLYVVKNGRPLLKLCDFGDATYVDPNNSSIVAKASFKGTVHDRACWVAPELGKLRTDERTKKFIPENPDELEYRKSIDYWSIGCVLFFVATRSEHALIESPTQRTNQIVGERVAALCGLGASSNSTPHIRAEPSMYSLGHLISQMVQEVPNRRMRARDALLHAACWSDEFLLNLVVQLAVLFNTTMHPGLPNSVADNNANAAAGVQRKQSMMAWCTQLIAQLERDKPFQGRWLQRLPQTWQFLLTNIVQNGVCVRKIVDDTSTKVLITSLDIVYKHANVLYLPPAGLERMREIVRVIYDQFPRLPVVLYNALGPGAFELKNDPSKKVLSVKFGP